MLLKRQEGYVLKSVAGESFLLPFGQQTADQKKGIKLNDTGAFLWELLKEPQSKEGLLAAMKKKYAPADEQTIETMEDDIDSFLSQLLAIGILRESPFTLNQQYTGRLDIAGLRIAVYGLHPGISEMFEGFFSPDEEAEPKKTDQIIDLVYSPLLSHFNGKILVRNEQLTVIEWEEGFILIFPEMKAIREVHMTADGSYARVYVRNTAGESVKEELFHVFRILFLYLAQRYGMFALHSASIAYRGKAWLFSGYSGMGKSTHTALWHELFGTAYLNGDLNLIGENENGILTIYGIPWCGTSGIRTTSANPLGGIVLLGRSKIDRLEQLSESEKILRVMQRMISPTWRCELLFKNLDFAEKLANKVPIWYLLCTKEPSAALLIKSEIDRVLENNASEKN